MPLVNRAISNMFGGVSQQPAGIRLDNQCEEVINAYPSITDGLVKRPPAEFIAPIEGDEGETLTLEDFRNSKMHTINRDGNEKYIVIFTGDSNAPIEIYDFGGTSKSVAYGTLDEDLTFTEDNDKKDYISGGSPADDIAAVTVADYTVVVNQTISPAMLPPSAPSPMPAAIITIPHGIASQTYKIYVNSNLAASFTTLDSNSPYSWRTTNIAYELGNDLMTSLPSPEWKITVDGCNIFLANALGNDFTLKTEDSWGDQAMVGIKESVRRFEDLPAVLPSGLDHDFDVVTVGGTGSHHNGYFRIYVDGVLKANAHSNDDPVSLTALYLYNALLINLCSNPVFRVSLDGWHITIWRTDGVHSVITASADEGTPEPFLHVSTSTVIDFTNSVFAVKPDPTTHNGTYYVRWNTHAEDGKITSGNWEECPIDGIATKFDAATMPHRLVRMPDETFVFAPIVWKDREVGDKISAPDPTFVGAPAQDVFFFKNRLGLLAKSNFVLSRAGEFFDFWPSTATDVLDDDPIDAACSSKQAAVLRYGVPFQTQLVIFSDQQQFSLSSGAALFTPKSATADLATSVAVERCEPVSIGSNIYFASPSGDFTSIREMFVATDTLITDSADVTAHCPTYIPANIKKLAACEGKDTVFVLSSDEPHSIFVYKFYWNGDQKAQSAWGKWTFSKEVLYMDVINNYLYLLFGEDGPPASVTVRPSTAGLESDRTPFQNPENAIDGSGSTAANCTTGAGQTASLLLSGFPEPYASGINIVLSVVVTGAGYWRIKYTLDNEDTWLYYDSNSHITADFEGALQIAIPPGTVMADIKVNILTTGDSVAASVYDVNLGTAEGAGGVFLSLERINLETKAVTAGETFKVLLDHQKVLSGSYSSGDTTFEAPYPVLSTDRAFNCTTKECVAVTVTGATTFSVPGNWAGAVVIFGRPYTLDHRFSEFGMKSADPKVYSRAGRGQLRTMNLSFEDTMSFDVVVSTVGRADTTQRFRASIPVTGEKRFTTLGDTRTTRVSIRSDSHLPCKFGGASYETMYAQRSK